MSKKSDKEAERQEAIHQLKQVLKPGDTVYTVLRYRSSSGMSRGIDVYYMSGNTPQWISYLVGKAIGERFNDNRECLSVSGCGMDMGFHVVYSLSHTLFKDDFECIGKSCPSNDHSNGDRDYTPHQHSDGGYALRHKWM